jgi:hypothetical protein
MRANQQEIRSGYFAHENLNQESDKPVEASTLWSAAAWRRFGRSRPVATKS